MPLPYGDVIDEDFMKKLLLAALLALSLSPLAAMASPQIDINSADATTLEQVRGIGPAKASAIVAYRQENGLFKSVDELVNVPGIGERSLEQVREQVTVGNETAQ